VKIHLLDTDPRQETDKDNYSSNHGSFSEVMLNLNKALQQLGHYAPQDEADFVGICDGCQIGFKYKDKKSFVISVWETSNCLPYALLGQAQGQRIFGLSEQITKLWHKAGFKDVKTVYGGCDTDFWKPTTPKSETFTFLHVNSSNVRSGLDITLNAFCMAFKKDQNVRLIIKDTNDSPKLREVIAKAQEYSNIEYITKRIHSYELRDLYSSSHVCLNLLRATSFGMPLLESSACGCLCVTGDIPPTNELIKKEYGILLPAKKELSIFAIAPVLAEEIGLLNCYPNFAYEEPPRFYTYNPYDYAELLQIIYMDWARFSTIDTRTPIVQNWKWVDSARKLIEYLNV
jgi:glycosyltransferase involved in cell wall biosynthesis